MYPANTPQPLPTTLRPDGRPVWEPPILDYSELIGEVYENRRETVTKYTNNNVVETTELRDIYVEEQLLWEYFWWVEEEVKKAIEAGDQSREFLTALKDEILWDGEIVEVEWRGKGGISFVWSVEDGSRVESGGVVWWWAELSLDSHP